jgi:hypothetical protein
MIRAKLIKMRFLLFIIFNNLPAIENGSTSLPHGNSELIRVSEMKYAPGPLQ